MTLYGNAYFLSNKTRMKNDVVPAYSNSESFINTAAECKTGTEVFANTEDNTTASRKVHVLLSHNGNKMPLNHAPGLNVAFLND